MTNQDIEKLRDLIIFSVNHLSDNIITRGYTYNLTIKWLRGYVRRDHLKNLDCRFMLSDNNDPWIFGTINMRITDEDHK